MVDYEDVGEFSFGVFKSFLKETDKDMKKFFAKYQIGFLPEGMDYSEYQKIKEKSIFKQLKFLIGKHPSLNIVLTGLYISSLDGLSKGKIIESNRHKIYEKYGTHGVSILNMASTGFIEEYVKWLTFYNVKNNPSQAELISFYEKILDDWQERAIFIQTNIHENSIINKITTKFNMGKDVFFICLRKCNLFYKNSDFKT